MSFGYNTLPSNFSSPFLIVQSSTFINNSATAEFLFLTSSRAFFAEVFTGRGGGIGVFINESRHDITVTITDCIFEGNRAKSFGGGLFLLLGGFSTHHKVFVLNNCFDSNVAEQGGGAIQSSFYNNGPQDEPLLALYDNCTIRNNTAKAGGGIFVVPSTTGMSLYNVMIIIIDTHVCIYFHCTCGCTFLDIGLEKYVADVLLIARLCLIAAQKLLALM